MDNSSHFRTSGIAPRRDTDSHLSHVPVHVPRPISRQHTLTHTHMCDHTLSPEMTHGPTHTRTQVHTRSLAGLSPSSLPLVTSAIPTHCRARLPPAHPSALVCLFLRKSPHAPQLPAWLRDALTKPHTLPRAPSQCLSHAHPGSCWCPSHRVAEGRASDSADTWKKLVRPLPSVLGACVSGPPAPSDPGKQEEGSERAKWGPGLSLTVAYVSVVTQCLSLCSISGLWDDLE